MDKFEQASRLKVRYDTPLGSLTVEDLWDLPLVSTNGKRSSLDALAIDLHRQIRNAAEVVSFVNPAEGRDRATELLTLRFEILKHVIDVRVAERDQARAAEERREKKARLLELVARKEDQELESRPLEELRALAASL